MKKCLSVFMAVLLCALTAIPAMAADSSCADYVITSPYANIDWDTVQNYKTQFHCHTTSSDGFLTVQQSVQMHYDLDYDVLAITDHGTNNLGWNNVPQTLPLLRETRKNRTGGAKVPIIPIPEEQYNAFLNGNASTSDGSVRTHNSGIVDVALGNELNMATPFADCHLTNYWSEYGQGLAGVYGDYETPSLGSVEDGGIVMIAHPGEYVYTNTGTTSRLHVGQPVPDYYARKFARIFLDYPTNSDKYSGAVVGMGINSSSDEHTRCDRILYDQILQKTIPNGVTPWGFTFSDSHNVDSLNKAYCMLLIPDWSDLDNDARNEKVRECMENGELFAISHYSNGFELDGEREFDGIDLDTDWPEDQLPKMNDTPMVTRMDIDEENDIITVEAKNANRIVWVSDCNVVKREVVNPTDGTAVFTIDLHDKDLKNDINLYLRFYITGEQGICYSQPMTIHQTDKDGKVIPFEPVKVPKTYDLPYFLRGFVTVLDWICLRWNPIVWAFKYFALGYNPLERLFKKAY